MYKEKTRDLIVEGYKSLLESMVSVNESSGMKSPNIDTTVKQMTSKVDDLFEGSNFSEDQFKTYLEVLEFIEEGVTHIISDLEDK